MKTSVVAAAGTTVIATVLGSLAGIALARRKGKWTIVFLALVFLILVTPEIVVAIALLIWYVRLKGPFGPGMTTPLVSYGILRLWAGHALFATAVVTLIGARASGRPRGDVRGGGGRSVRDALAAVQPDHVATHDACGARRGAARVHLQP